MTLPNIAVSGSLRAGKDCVAAYLTSRYGYTRFAFGDGIKDVCRRLFPDQFADGRKPRALLQCVGQAMRTIGDENVWINDMFRRIDVYENEPLRVVVTDVRQPNEVAALKERGYTLIRVTCPLQTRIERARAAGDVFSSADLTHETESYVDTFDVDYTIANDGTLGELYAKVDAMMSSLALGATTSLTEVDV